MCLNINPPISYRQISNLISEIEPFDSREIDGKILAFAIKLAYTCGLRSSEMVSLKISDVYRKANALNSIEVLSVHVDGRLYEVRFTGTVKQIVEGHIDYLRSTRDEHIENLRLFRYETFPYSPLLPRKSGVPYDDKTLRRHFRSVAGNDEIWKLTFENIRQSGICKRYDELKASGNYTDSDVLEMTTAFARVTKNQTEHILTGSKQKPGNTHQSRMRYLGSNDQISWRKLFYLVIDAPKQHYEKDSSEGAEFKVEFFTAVDRNRRMSPEEKEKLKKLCVEELGI
jgi:hypothetical protein